MNAGDTYANVLAGSSVVHDTDSLLRAIKVMGAEIDSVLGGEEAVFLTIMNGALVFAGHLALTIRSPLVFDYAHATRYHHGTEGKKLEWLRRPTLDMTGRTVLLVDDILDEGHTLKAIRDACLAAGAKRALVAALCSKRHDRRTEGIEADFCGVEVPDAFVFGFGMDYRGQGRNLPQIRAPETQP